MGTLLTMLALMSFCAAPEPTPAPTQDAAVPIAPPTQSAPDASAQEESAPAPAAEPAAQQPLRPMDFRPGAQTLHTSRPAYDLRNPFNQRVLPPLRTAPATAKKGATGAARSELRDPFTEPRPTNKRRPQPAQDLRDPFRRPRALPKCPDTGGVPIQRPSSVQPGCVQASRRAVFAQL